MRIGAAVYFFVVDVHPPVTGKPLRSSVECLESRPASELPMLLAQCISTVACFKLANCRKMSFVRFKFAFIVACVAFQPARPCWGSGRNFVFRL